MNVRRAGRVAELYATGLTLKEIAGELGLSETTVVDDLALLGVRRRRPGPRPSVQVERRRDRVVELYVTRDFTCAQIAIALGVRRNLVYHDLEARHVPARERQRLRLACAKRRRRARQLAGRGLDRTEIARRLGVSRRTVSRDLAA